MAVARKRGHDESVNLLTMQTVWPFVLIVLVLLLVMVVSLELLSSVRAFVGAESLWSKGQKQAVISLENYAHTRLEKDYRDYLLAIRVPLGDRRARLAMNKDVPDLQAAYAGFLAGGNLPDDIPGMVRLYRYFGATPLMRNPIRVWTTADLQIAELIEVGRSIHQDVEVGRQPSAGALTYRARLDQINRTVTPLERDFSASMAVVSLRAQELIEAFLSGLTLVLLALGIWFSRRLAAQRIASAHDLRKKSEMNLAFLQNASDGIHILDANGNVREASDSFCMMLGYERQAVMGMNVARWNAELGPDELQVLIKDMIDQRSSIQLETKHRNRDGAVVDVEVSAAPLELDGQSFIYASTRDITQRKQVEQALRQSRERLDALYTGAPDGILIVDSETRLITDANPRICAMLDFTKEQFAQMPFDDLFQSEGLPEASGFLDGVVDKAGGVTREVEVVASDGHRITSDISVSHIEIGSRSYLACFVRDVTERQHARAQIAFMAHHDLLTGLPNRGLFMDRLKLAQVSAQRDQRYGAVLFVDLDHFKNINDVHGHCVGDRILKAISDRLGRHLRAVDTVARLGGDEFVVLLPDLSSSQEAAAALALSVGEKVRAALEEPVHIGDQDFASTASIGISLFPRYGASVDDVVREADIAMYRAKANGRNSLVIFENEMAAQITEHYALERDLREAVRQGDLQIHLQSKLSVDGQLVGAEALARWHHRERGSIPPSVFIAIAEQSDLILTLGDWVFRQVCERSVQIGKAGHRLNLAVNVSPRQFHQGNFVPRIKEIISQTGADPRCLTLEITENLLIEHTSAVISQMLELASIGIRFSIDDFGTGYSSLAYLKRLPLKELKIDHSFVKDVPGDANDVALVETILSVARHLHLEVVAEGVESQAQLDFMTDRGCRLFQGYLLHRPQAAQEWIENLHAHADSAS